MRPSVAAVLAVAVPEPSPGYRENYDQYGEEPF